MCTPCGAARVSSRPQVAPGRASERLLGGRPLLLTRLSLALYTWDSTLTMCDCRISCGGAAPSAAHAMQVFEHAPP